VAEQRYAAVIADGLSVSQVAEKVGRGPKDRLPGCGVPAVEADDWALPDVGGLASPLKHVHYELRQRDGSWRGRDRRIRCHLRPRLGRRCRQLIEVPVLLGLVYVALWLRRRRSDHIHTIGNSEILQRCRRLWSAAGSHHALHRCGHSVAYEAGDFTSVGADGVGKGGIVGSFLGDDAGGCERQLAAVAAGIAE
jgi:hypothetical protein